MIRRLREYLIVTLLEEQERWLLWLPVAMGCGVLLYFHLENEPRQFIGLYALMLAAPSLWRWKRFPLLRAAMLGCFGMALGFAAAQFQAQRLQTPVLERPIRMTTLQGHLTQVQDTENGMKLMIQHPVAENNRYPVTLPDIIRLNLRQSDPALRAGQQVRLRAGIFPLPQPALPGGYDIARHFYFQGIGAVGFALAPVEVLQEAKVRGVEEALNDLRHQFSRKIRHAMPGAEGTIADALITGEQSAIPKGIRDAWAVAGITHMLSISGLHLSLVAGIMFIAVRLLLVLIPGIALRFPVKKWAAVAALLGSFGYLALAGFPVAANRSFLMVGLVLGAVILDRQVLSLRSVALAAILLLLWMPESLLGPSFQLSFAATVAIVALYEVYRRTPLSQQYHDWWLMRPWFYLCGIALTSLVAGLATTPYIVIHFHQFTIYPILANLLTSPILSLLVMPMGMLAICLMPLGWEAPPLAIMQWGIARMIALAEWVAELPNAVTYVPPFPGWGIACFTLGALWLCCWRQKWRLAGIPLIVIGMGSLAFTRLPDIVIAPLGELVALRTPEGGYVMAKGGTRNFKAEIWQESLGITEFTPAQNFKPLRCDSEGCIAILKNHTIALPKLREASSEDCHLANIMVTDFYADCPRSAFNFSRPRDAIALWWEDDGIRAERARSYVSRLVKPRWQAVSRHP